MPFFSRSSNMLITLFLYVLAFLWCANRRNPYWYEVGRYLLSIDKHDARVSVTQRPSDCMKYTSMRANVCIGNY